MGKSHRPDIESTAPGAARHAYPNDRRKRLHTPWSTAGAVLGACTTGVTTPQPVGHARKTRDPEQARTARGAGVNGPIRPPERRMKK